MPTTITVNGSARVYKKAFDNEYKAQIDAGNTGIAKASVAATTDLPGVGESIALKSVTNAGKGNRGSQSIKDKIFVDGSTTTRDFTFGFFAYFPKADKESAQRLKVLAAALIELLESNSFSAIDDLVLGSVDWPA